MVNLRISFLISILISILSCSSLRPEVSSNSTFDEVMEYFASKARNNYHLMSKSDFFEIWYLDTLLYYTFIPDYGTVSTPYPGMSEIIVALLDTPFLYPDIPNTSFTIRGKTFVWNNPEKPQNDNMIPLLERNGLLTHDSMDWWDSQYINDLEKIQSYYFKTGEPGRYKSRYSNRILHEPPKL